MTVTRWRRLGDADVIQWTGWPSSDQRL